MENLYQKISYQSSKNVTNVYSTSFSLAVKMLSPKIQQDIYSIYGFVRIADEIVDSFHEFDKETLLNEFETEMKTALDRKISTNPIINSFQEVVHKYNIDTEYIDAFMKSMRVDLYKQTYSTQAEYEEYIYGSADVVGLMCLKIFVNGNQAEFDRLKASAMKLGSAFQKVNFLRDLKDDSELLQRSYFPHLKDSEISNKTKEEIINEIKADFDAAYLGIKGLPKEAKFGVYTAYVYYKQLLFKLENTNFELLKTKRIRVSNAMKSFLLVKSYLKYNLKMI
ncbi:MAG: phytoene/squalene synthase family protein [Chitinophagales bacterium]